jgi:hypothetical protein
MWSLTLLMGADQYAEFPTWREPEEIRRFARLAVLTREGTMTVRRGRRVGVAAARRKWPMACWRGGHADRHIVHGHPPAGGGGAAHPVPRAAGGGALHSRAAAVLPKRAWVAGYNPGHPE